MSEESEVAEVDDDFTIDSGNLHKHNYENVSISEGQVIFQSILKKPKYQIQKLDFTVSEYFSPVFKCSLFKWSRPFEN